MNLAYMKCLFSASSSSAFSEYVSSSALLRSINTFTVFGDTVIFVSSLILFLFS